MKEKNKKFEDSEWLIAEYEGKKLVKSLTVTPPEELHELVFYNLEHMKKELEMSKKWLKKKK